MKICFNIFFQGEDTTLQPKEKTLQFRFFISFVYIADHKCAPFKTVTENNTQGEIFATKHSGATDNCHSVLVWESGPAAHRLEETSSGLRQREAYKRHNHQLPLEEPLSYLLLEGYPPTPTQEWLGQLQEGRIKTVTLLERDSRHLLPQVL